MKQSEVEQILRKDPNLAKEISLNDGKRYRVSGHERWLAGPWLTILNERGEYVFVSYHNIASIRIVKPNGGGRRRPRRQ